MQWEIHKQAVKGDDLRLLNSSFNIQNADLVSGNVAELQAKEVFQSPDLAPIAAFFKGKLEEQSGLSGLVLEKVWFVYSVSQTTDAKKLPYLPHFDKKRFLKAMVYLGPVDSKNGAIRLGRVSNEDAIEVRRRTLPSDYKEKRLNCIDSIELIESLEDVEGDAGDVVFFDTNVPHAAGIVDQGYERRVVRFDFSHPTFESEGTERGIIEKTLARVFRFR